MARPRKLPEEGPREGSCQPRRQATTSILRRAPEFCYKKNWLANGSYEVFQGEGEGGIKGSRAGMGAGWTCEDLVAREVGSGSGYLGNW